MAYRHFNGEEGPDKGPRLRPEANSISNNDANPLKRSLTGDEFPAEIQMELHVRPHKLAELKVSELHVRPHKLAALKVSGGSTRSTGTIKLNIRPTSEATSCPNTKGPSPRVSGGPTRSTGTLS